ncbi:pirin domain-containing protein [Trametes polyzona]|nr:pirin domain-containing protein [Trametes polyzona]
MKVVPRPSNERGHADHGWLKTFHTFSFANHYDPQHEHYGPLRVINEDRVNPRTGFGTHAHREFEIFSYIVSGELEHRDSMGNVEVMKRGDLQMTSAGTGIRHSEHCHGDKQVHFLQIWAFPSEKGLTPQYFTRHFSDEEKKDQWAHIVAPINAPGVSEKREAFGPAPVHSPLNLFATLLSPGKSLSHTFQSGSAQKKGYLHVVQTSGYNTGEASGAYVRVVGAEGGPVDLREGDGAYIMAGLGEDITLENAGDAVAEVLLFDME